MSRKEAVLNKKNMDGKMAEMDIAIIFDGFMYNGNEIYREDKMFYCFNGKTYEYIADEVIKSQLQQFMYKDKPASGRVNGAFNSLCNHVLKQGLENGSWLHKPHVDAKNISVFDNGLVDMSLDNPVLMPHNRNFFSFSQKDYDFDSTATCPNFEKFLEEIFEHDPDNKILLLEYIGLLLTYEIKYQKFLFLKGVPRGGKGVITNLIRNLVGKENCANPSLQNLHRDPTLATLSTKSVAFLDDVRTLPINVREIALSTYLQITGCDAMTYEVKFKPNQTNVIPSRFVMSGNEVPSFIDIGGALVARMLMVTFEKSFRGKENENLFTELTPELSGISNLAQKHYRAMQKRGHFTQPKSGEIEKEEMREELFPLSTFINDNCILEDGQTASSSDLFASYLVHCNQNKIKYSVTKTKLNKQLRGSDLALRMKRQTINNVKENWFYGVGLNDASKKVLSLNSFPNRSKEDE
jgi:putative DNA primase/helicase